MAGAKRAKSDKDRSHKRARMESTRSRVNPVTSKDSKQTAKTRFKGGKEANQARSQGQQTRKNSVATATIVEDDQIVEMEAEGQLTEFISEDEQDLEKQEETESSEDDGEVVFNSQENNNAS